MNIINKIKSKFVKNSTPISLNERKLLDLLGISGAEVDVKSQVTYFTCLKILSETIGKLPIKVYKETNKGVLRVYDKNLSRVLTLRPNKYMTPSIFWSTVEQNKNHYGNAYVWCRYEGSKLKDLWIMQSDCVTVMIDDTGYFGGIGKIYYQYTDPNTLKEYLFDSDNVLHFKTSSTFNGLIGKPVREMLKGTVEGGLYSQSFMNNLYKSGLTAKAVLEYTGDLDENARKRLKEGFEQFANGSENSGKIIPVPLGMKLTPLNIKLTDSQFFELKKYNSLEIAGAFGIKPTFINNFDNASYSNTEAEQLAFLINTLQFPMKQYEEEMSYKLLSNKQLDEGCYLKFNEGAILRADAKTQAECLSMFVQNAIKSPNEVRRILDLPTVDEGDDLMCNGNYIKLSQLGANYGIEGGE